MSANSRIFFKIQRPWRIYTVENLQVENVGRNRSLGLAAALLLVSLLGLAFVLAGSSTGSSITGLVFGFRRVLAFFCDVGALLFSLEEGILSVEYLFGSKANKHVETHANDQLIAFMPNRSFQTTYRKRKAEQVHELLRVEFFFHGCVLTNDDVCKVMGCLKNELYFDKLCGLCKVLFVSLLKEIMIAKACRKK